MNNREIKFRFWNKKKKAMLPGHHDITKGTPMIGDFEWLQFTGLTDSEGTDVYDGDILFNYDGNAHCEVKMIEGCWSAVYPKNTLNTKESIFVLKHSVGNLYNVAGNIYENPEILK
jgi:hypothetical protein